MSKKIIIADPTDANNAAEVRVNNDMICISDIAHLGRGRPADIIRNYIKAIDNLTFLGEWEKRYNANFKVDRYDHFRLYAIENANVPRISEYIEQTGAIGIQSKAGRYGGTFAHIHIATHFANWLKPVFYLNLVELFWERERAKLTKQREDMIYLFKQIENKSIDAANWARLGKDQISKDLLE